MNSIFTGREPRLPLKYFEEISIIPRASRNEAAAADYIVGKANTFGLEVYRDHANNVLVKKDATPGFENVPPVLLQGHIDMVAQKLPGSTHNFDTDGIELILDGNILRANGTTLGGDDAKGIAPMLALMDLDSNSFDHPPLEFLFTTGEEIGLIGALSCTLYDKIKSRRMINIDAGPEGRVAVSAAGNCNVEIACDVCFEKAEGALLAIEISGLLGGHSGMKIAEERGNANKLLGRVLHQLQKAVAFRLCSVEGGKSMNAIAANASAVIALSPADREKALEVIRQVNDCVATELKASDPDVKITAADGTAAHMMTAESTRKVVDCLFTLPNGVYCMSKEIEGLPITSTNLGILKTTDHQVQLLTMVRSALVSSKDDYVELICSVAALCGMEHIEVGDWTPAWPYNSSSRLRETAMAVFQEKYGKEMRILAGHAGLEVGVFIERIPGIDIIAIGATGGNTHTATEWLDLDSFARVYDYVKSLLTALTKEV